MRSFRRVEEVWRGAGGVQALLQLCNLPEESGRRTTQTLMVQPRRSLLQEWGEGRSDLKGHVEVTGGGLVSWTRPSVCFLSFQTLVVVGGDECLRLL